MWIIKLSKRSQIELWEINIGSTQNFNLYMDKYGMVMGILDLYELKSMLKSLYMLCI
jgi:hypothetical protein